MSTYKPLSFEQAKALKAGDVVYIGMNDHSKAGGKRSIAAVVLAPLFWNSDADEPDWEVETSNGFSDVYSLNRKTGFEMIGNNPRLKSRVRNRK